MANLQLRSRGLQWFAYWAAVFLNARGPCMQLRGHLESVWFRWERCAAGTTEYLLYAGACHPMRFAHVVCCTYSRGRIRKSLKLDVDVVIGTSCWNTGDLLTRSLLERPSGVAWCKPAPRDIADNLHGLLRPRIVCSFHSGPIIVVRMVL